MSHIGEVVDMAIHCQKQNLEIDAINLFHSFCSVHRALYGSNKYVTDNYGAKMEERYRWAYERTWDEIEFLTEGYKWNQERNI